MAQDDAAKFAVALAGIKAMTERMHEEEFGEVALARIEAMASRMDAAPEAFGRTREQMDALFSRVCDRLAETGALERLEELAEGLTPEQKAQAEAHLEKDSTGARAWVDRKLQNGNN